MRIGIDCRIYGSSHGYMGKYLENFISYLEQNEDGNEYVLFLHEREWGEFVPKSSRFQPVKTVAKIGTLADQLFFPYELRRQKLDIVLFPHPYSPVFSFRKNIVILSDLVPYFYPEKHLKRSLMRHWHTFLLRTGIRKSHVVIALSETLKRDIIEVFDMHEDRIHVIPPMCLYVPETKSSQTNDLRTFLLQESISEKYMLFVWDLKEHKNIPRLLEAYHLLLEEDGNLPDIILVWKEDPAYHKIRSTLIQFKLQGRVHIYNILDDEKVELLYRYASLYVVPSLYEGSEEAILAPLAYSLPIATSALPSITAVLSKDEAIFFRPMSIFEMKEALKKALSNPSAQHAKKDMSRYSAAAVSTELLNIFASSQENPEK